MNSLADLWQNILAVLEEKLSTTTINTWFDEVKIVAVEDQAIVLHCGNDFKRDVIQRKFLTFIYMTVQNIFSQGMEIKILDDAQLAAYHGVRPDHPGASSDFDSAFTFETFVAGPQNKLAYSAARAVVEVPAKKYNPLFIYGDSGLGKTHLLYAIRNRLPIRHPGMKVVYVKGEEFINEFIELVRSGRGDEFRAKYRDADMLLVDDIQFVAGKEQVQNEFFHTFNTLYEAGKQIVMTSDRPPREMSLLDDRLRTRFEWGLMADVAPPDYETRLAIIRNKSKILGMSLTDEIMDYIAENVTANVRQIEGILNKILAYWDLLGDQLDTDSLEKAIMDTVRKANDYITPTYVIQSVARFFNLDEDTLRGQERRKDVTNARQVAMYLMRRMIPSMALKEIGKEFDGRDHTTVLHSLDKVEKQMRTDPAFAETVKEITTNIKAHK